ncbi:MAG: glycosyl hydrolase family 18 protein [Thermomicrobiales bacterium]
MRARLWRWVLCALLAGAVLPLLPAGTPHAAAAGVVTVRWGYYVTYAADSLVSLKANVDSLTHVSPYYYALKTDSTIDTKNEQPATTALLRDHHVKVVPMIKNGPTYNDFHNLIDTPQEQDRLVAALVALVTSKGYDGINIDFEGLNPTDRPLLTDFMRRLHAQLSAAGKLTTMAVPAKATDTTTGWGGAYDYAALAPSLDYVVVMAYDFHYAGGTPGPVAPVNWVRGVARYAAAQFGAGKTILGVPFYGLDWDTKTKQPASTVKMDAGPLLTQRPNATSGYSTTDAANWVKYTDDHGDPHEAWYESEQSITAKLGVVTDLGLAGFGAWRLGQEDGGAWNAIHRLDTPATRVPPVANTATQHYFPETGQVVQGAFLRYWQEYGGLAQFGLPRTREFQEVSPYNGQSYTVQYFERARFELHPEYAGTPYEVLLGLLGRDFHAIDPPAPQRPGASYFSQTGHNLDGAFRDYWLSHGGLFVSGLPITEAFTEISPTDGKPYTVQYFERARYEYHPEKDPPFDVLLGLLGNQLVQQKGWIP